MTKPLSPVLLVLLYFAKRAVVALPDDEKLTWKHVRSALKHADYDQADDMKLGNVLRFALDAVIEAASHPDLRVPDSARVIENIIMAPIASHFALKWPHWNMRLEDQYALEDVYNAMFKQLISDLALTSVAKCVQYVEYANARDLETARIEESFSKNSNWLTE